MLDAMDCFSDPEKQEITHIDGKTVALFRCTAYVMGETKYFWSADCGGLAIATACDSRQECMEKARNYLSNNK